MIRPAPLLTIAPSYSILSIEAGEPEHNPHVAIYLKLGGLAYMLGGCSSGRTSENSVNRKFNFRECPKGEVRRIPILSTLVHKGKKKGRG